MKITKIRWVNHEKLGNLELDFTKDGGSPYKTIILAGENGTGKTAILDSIFECLSDKVPNILGQNGHVPEDQAGVIIHSILEDRDLVTAASTNPNVQLTTPKRAISYLGDGNRKGLITTHFFDSSGSEISNTTTHRPYAIYSNIAINYNPKNINSSTNKELDTRDNQSEKAPEDLATEITQLFIDIDTADSSELQTWVDEHSDERPPDAEKHKRIKRFSKAFKIIFGNTLKLDSVKQLKVMFKKHGSPVPIESLSSGEKQVVFRGGFLLRNRDSLNGATVLIDEPELSMHPIWQEQILEFYKKLFMNQNNTQTSQIFIATHSEHIIKNLSEDDAIFVLRRDSSDNIIADATTRFNILPQSPTYNEVKYRAFNLPTQDFHDELFGFLQESQSKTVKELDAFFTTQTGVVQKHWVGKKLVNGNVQLVQNLDTESLPVYIRNYSHHPELRGSDNAEFTTEELRNSIKFLISIIKQMGQIP